MSNTGFLMGGLLAAIMSGLDEEREEEQQPWDDAELNDEQRMAERYVNMFMQAVEREEAKKIVQVISVARNEAEKGPLAERDDFEGRLAHLSTIGNNVKPKQVDIMASLGCLWMVATGHPINDDPDARGMLRATLEEELEELREMVEEFAKVSLAFADRCDERTLERVEESLKPGETGTTGQGGTAGEVTEELPVDLDPEDGEPLPDIDDGDVYEQTDNQADIQS